MLSKAFIRDFNAAALKVYKWITQYEDPYTGFRDYVIYTRSRLGGNSLTDFKHIKMVNILDINYDDLERFINPDITWLTDKDSNFNITNVLKILTDLEMSLEAALDNIYVFTTIVVSVIFVDAAFKYPLINFPVYARGMLKKYLSYRYLPHSDNDKWDMFVGVLIHSIKYNAILVDIIHIKLKHKVLLLSSKKEDIDQDDNCPICYDICEYICYVNCCGQFIYQSCICKVLDKTGICPMCRTSFKHGEMICIREVCKFRARYIKQKYPHRLKLTRYISKYQCAKQYITD